MTRKYTKRRPEVPPRGDWLTAVLNVLSRLTFARRSPAPRLLAIVAVLAFALLMAVAAFLLALAGVVVAAVFLFPDETDRFTALSAFFSVVAGGGYAATRLRHWRRGAPGAEQEPQDPRPADLPEDAADGLA